MASSAENFQNVAPLAARKPLSSAIKIAATALLTLGLMAMCYTTPVRPELMPLHNIHQHLFYIPIILAAYWFGVRGGMICAISVFLLYVPHLASGPHAMHSRMYDLANWSDINHYLEGGTYLLIGFMTGYLTDKLRAEQRRLAGAMDHLTDKTREVFEAEEQLRRSDRLAALGQLSAGLAHEIRNPLGSIRGAAEILGDAETSAEQRVDFSRVLIDETARLDDVLTHFLDYARTQRHDDAAPGVCELGPVVERLTALLGAKIEKAGIVLERAIPGSLPSLAVSEALLQQALLNLMLNAVQAMPDGGRLKIEGSLDGEKRKVAIYVNDSGPGIPEAIATKIFDPFFTTKTGGTGLGLSIVHKIAESQHGRVWLDATGPQGSRLGLEFPAASF